MTVVEPRFVPGLPDEAAAFAGAVRRPVGSPPLRDIVRATDRVAVVIPDLTRPLPSARLLTWLFEELAHVPAERFTIVNGTGSHRANTPKSCGRWSAPSCSAATGWSTTRPTTRPRCSGRDARATARRSS